MSVALLEANQYGTQYLQSPIDDLWSFYYVAQWAAVFNNTYFPDSTPIPPGLARLRHLLSSYLDNRNSVTFTIMSHDKDDNQYGQMLKDCSGILREWHNELQNLAAAWKVKVKEAKIEALHVIFRDITDKALLDLVRLVDKHYGGSLSGI